jgi:hypothetical protein
MKSFEAYERQIPLYLYGELSGEELKAFERHLKSSIELQTKVEEIRLLHGVLAKKKTLQPSEELLKDARRHLLHRLREEKRKMIRENWLAQLQDRIRLHRGSFELAGAIALLAAGLLIGRWSLYQENIDRVGSAAVVADIMPVSSNVDIIQYDSQTGLVSVQYKTVKNVSLQGDINDAAIRRILGHAIRSESHPGRRLTALKAVQTGRFNDTELEKALIFAMENDTVEGVRLKSARVLKQLAMNENIKNAFIRSLLKDENSAVRLEALDALGRLGIEDEIAPIFMTASREDQNESIRYRASKALQRLENTSVP